MIRLNKMVICATLILLSTSAVRADTLWIGDSMADAIKVDGLKVQDASGDKLGYTTDEGMVTSKVFSKLQEINIDGATTFNSAEDAYARRDYDSAITGYQSVLESSAKDWMQRRAAVRMIAAGKAKNRYDTEVVAYVALLRKDAVTAAANRPSEPPQHSPYLDAALASIAKGLDDPKLDDSNKSTLLNLQLQIGQVKGDTVAVRSTLQQLVALGGGTDAMKATLKLADANVAYQSKQYSQAIDDIEQNKGIFTDPDQQIDALFILAQAKYAADGDKSDPNVLKDLALNYMRVVTFGNPLPEHPHVAESLYQAGQIEEKLNDRGGAIQLYTQLVNERAFAGSPFKDKAETALARLKTATASK